MWVMFLRMISRAGLPLPSTFVYVLVHASPICKVIRNPKLNPSEELPLFNFAGGIPNRPPVSRVEFDSLSWVRYSSILECSCPEPELYPEVSIHRRQSTHTRIPLGKLFAVGRLFVCQRLWEAWAQLHPPKWTPGAAKCAGQKGLSGQAESQQLAHSTGVPLMP